MPSKGAACEASEQKDDLCLLKFACEGKLFVHLRTLTFFYQIVDSWKNNLTIALEGSIEIKALNWIAPNFS